ncbi:PAS domain S-box protein [Lutibacter sp.]|uniref:hybrid sensor histidine kinase/response regulator n=1 Tax=Lutibacter sp. TaxID=1925666 RepID=UPI00356942E8
MKSQQKRIEETLKFISNEGYQISADEFLQKIAKFLTHLLEIEYILIEKYLLKTPTITETVVVCNKQNILSNFSYELANTPCENVINKNICIYPSNIQSLFPKDELLVQMNIESYVGIPLWSSKGEPIGLIALLDSKQIIGTENIKIILQICAIKVEKVLEKIIFENTLELEIKKLEALNKLNKEIEEKYSKAFFNNPIAMEIVDFKTGERIEANESYFQIFEYAKDEFYKGNIFTNKLIIDAGIRDIINKKLAEIGSFKDSDFSIVSKSGKIKNLLVSGARLNIDDGNKALLTFKDITEEKQSKILLQNSEKKFKKIANLTFEGIIIHNNGIVIDINHSFEKMFGYNHDELIGKDFVNILYPKKYHKIIRENRDKNNFLPIEIEGIRKDGTVFPIEVKGRYFSSEENKVFRVASVRDLTEKNKIQEQTKKLSTAIEQSANTIVITDPCGTIEYVNSKFTEITGFALEEVIGKNPRILSSGKQPKEYYAKMWKTITAGKTWQGEFQNKAKNGILFWEQVTITSIKNNLGEITNYLAVKEDITKRKHAEEKLIEATQKIKNSEQKFRELFEKSGDAILIIKNGIFIECNEATVKMLGYNAKEEFLNLHPSQLSPKQQPDGLNSMDKADEIMKTVLKIGSRRFEWLHTKKDGINFYVEVLLTVISSEPENKIIHCVWRDITERKKSEKGLISAFETIKENEESLNRILETANEGFWVINTEGLTTKVNPEMSKILECAENEMIGKSIFEFVDDENKKVFTEQLKNRFQGASSAYEIELKTSSGKRIPCLFKTSPVYNKNEKIIGSFALVTDISILKNAYEMSENQNQELKNLSLELSEKNTLLFESNSRFKSLFEESPVSIWEQDFSEVIQLINSKGIATKDVKKYLNENLDFANECISKIKIINVNHKTLELLGVKNKEDLITHIRKSNNNKAINIVVNEIVSIVLGNKEFKSETEFLHTNGAIITAMIKSNVVDNSGKVIASVIDISALNKAKEKAEESDRLKTEFLNNMSHEIRTPMNGILGFSEMLNDPDIDSQKRNNFVKIIQNSGKQLMHIIDDILEISSLGTKQVKVEEEEVCINDVMLELFSIFDIKAKENKTPLYLKKALSDEESTIISDRSKLNKILSNLLENALKFTNNGFIEFGYYLKNSNTQLEIYVKDTGIGIKPEKQELIFERFAQAEKELTKKVGGLGLGLSIAKENTELLGGKISVKSEMMEGATFFVNLPFNPIYTLIETEENNNKYTILIAEDEEVNYIYLETILKDIMKLNCDILHAKNGREAIDICQNNSTINIVLMDLKMPVLNGFLAVKKIREFRPNLPIIAQTAYSTIEDREEAINIGCNDFISKPIGKDVLMNVINNYLKDITINLD